jgi:alkanesulfonate monooxygenase SsuD/methylene tetrahydromethanopterin reductase-like flavin-dependent oxidoreductase (luciferase family)
MQYDIFFSISQTPVRGELPSEEVMWRNFFEQVQAADRLRFGTAWVACSHLSTEVQKRHPNRVVPHWQGEIGLNNDIFQLAHKVFAQTERIAVGSAIMNLLSNGGPVARAEQVATFASIHGLDRSEGRPLRFGFAAGRFDFMIRAYGIVPRDSLEEAAWPVLKGKVFAEAVEIFLRLLNGEALSGSDTAPTTLSRSDFRTDEDWAKVRALASTGADTIEVPRRYAFDVLKIVPQEWRRELVDLFVGSHEPALQVRANTFRPVKVFNLSITKPEVIDQTHARMREHFHRDGGAWKREYMPRTVMVFLNEEAGISVDEKRRRARAEADEALAQYWNALEGTIDPKKVSGAADNALIGTASDVAAQIRERFHPDDRLMLWFDFFNHDSARVVRNMEAFSELVIPAIGDPS